MINKSIDHRINEIDTAIERIRRGGLVLVRDDEGRENEGDLVGAAELATAEMIAFMAVHGRGLICQSITEEAALRPGLNPQAPVNTDSMGTAFTISVDAAEGITTGISAEDRARTARILAYPETRPEQLRRPGHLFPLAAKKGGVFSRSGHTEASADLVRLAGLEPSGLICEVMNADGTMARGEELEKLAARWEMPLISVEDLLAYRDARGDMEFEESPASIIPTPFGDFTLQVFRGTDPNAHELILLRHPGKRTTKDDGIPLVRLHSECLTGEAFHSLRCDCGPQLKESLRLIAREGGALVYLRQEGRGIGLFDKIKAYALQDQGHDTISANIALGHKADPRRYGSAAAVLIRAGMRKIRLLTNNPEKISSLKRAGIQVVERVPHHAGATEENAGYRAVKTQNMGHFAPLRTAI